MDIEKITTLLIFLMEENGIPIDSKSRIRTYIYHAFNEDRIKFIQKDNEIIGFMIWEIHKDNHIYVSQLLILPKFKGYNIKTLATFLKQKYSIGNKNIHWHSHKRNRLIDFNKKELTHV